MKRILSVVSVLMLLLCAVPCASVQASDFRVVSETTEVFEDGSYIVTTVSEDVALSGNAARAGYNKTGSKTVVGYAADNSQLFSFTVTGTFVVNEGVVSACITARYSHAIYNSVWSLQSGNAAKTGNQAVGTGTFIKTIAGVKVDTRTVQAVLTCDKYGVLS